MSSRLLLSGTLAAPIARHNRRDDGRLFGVTTIRDDVSNESRLWTVFVNRVELIERFERLKPGEPVAIAGPFSVKLDGTRLVHRISADAVIGARKERKKLGATESAAAVDPNDAPKDDRDGGAPLDDPIPF
jgi:hypothetical protein